MSPANPAVGPAEQCVRMKFTVNSAQVNHQYGEFQVIWNKAFADTKYTVIFTFSHLSVGSPGQSRLFTNNGYRDKEPTGFLAVVGCGSGAVAGDLIEIEAYGIHD